jgi:molecular chaperone IbpA
MPRSDFDRLFDQLETLTVGFGPFFRDFQVSTAQTSYPPHNILRHSESEFILELAVAGFKKDQITASMQEGMLVIKGDKSTGAEPTDSYQYRGIANRSFTKSFRIAEFYEIVDAKLEDGILSVLFKKNIPEEAKPKLIPIN